MLDKEILIVDDEKDLRDMICSIFSHAGYTKLVTAASGEEALALLSKKMPGIIIMDVMMPGLDGFALLQEVRAVCRRLRAEGDSTPVLMLTAKGEAEDRFAGFELGADDYLVKPFLPKELLLRVRAILKRVYSQENNIVTLEASYVDLDRAEAVKGEQRLPLTAKEYAIFQKLAENPGRIVTIGVLCQMACGDIWQGYENTLMTHIRHLREKIEENPSKPVSLLTVKGLGYKLMVKEPEK